jgi:hypothetical protein
MCESSEQDQDEVIAGCLQIINQELRKNCKYREVRVSTVCLANIKSIFAIWQELEKNLFWMPVECRHVTLGSHFILKIPAPQTDTKPIWKVVEIDEQANITNEEGYIVWKIKTRPDSERRIFNLRYMNAKYYRDELVIEQERLKATP